MLSGSGSTMVAFYKNSELDEVLVEKIKFEINSFLTCEYKILNFQIKVLR